MAMKSRIGPLALEAPLGNAPAPARYFELYMSNNASCSRFACFYSTGPDPESRRDFAAQLEELKAAATSQHRALLRRWIRCSICLSGLRANRRTIARPGVGQTGTLTLGDSVRIRQTTGRCVAICTLMGWVHGRIRPEKCSSPTSTQLSPSVPKSV